MGQKTALYRHFSESGNLLYVGVSLSAVQRLSQHKDHSKWFDEIHEVKIEWFPSRSEALDAETKAIQRESPLHNIMKKGDRKGKRETAFQRAERERDRLLNEICVMRPFYTVQDTANMLLTSPNTIRKMIEAGRISAIVTGRHKRKTISGEVKDVCSYLVTGWSIIDLMEHAHANGTFDL